jgi:hypothetical protein
MKILYTKQYIGRILFLIEKDEKIIMCYRSSGLSGTGQGGEILPFAFLNEKMTLSTVLGYLWKEMFYDGSFISHKKYLSRYPHAEEIMREIKELTRDIEAEDFKNFNDELSNMDKFKKFVKSINQEMKDIIGDREFYDFCTSEEREMRRRSREETDRILKEMMEN